MRPERPIRRCLTNLSTRLDMHTATCRQMKMAHKRPSTYCCKESHTKCTGIRSPERKPGQTVQVENNAKAIQWGKDSLFNKWYQEKLDIHIQKSEVELYLRQIKYNSNWVEDLNIRV